MPAPYHNLVVSNSLDELSNALFYDLFEKGLSPFECRLVVVPSLPMKLYLTKRFLGNRFGIVAGVKFVTIAEALREIEMRRGVGESTYLPSTSFLAFGVAAALTSFLALGDERFQEIDAYLGDQASSREKKMGALSRTLARLFTSYGIYGGKALIGWLSENSWAQAIWKKIFNPRTRWTFPIEKIESLPSSVENIFLFHCDTIAPLFFRYFSKSKMYAYTFSPSMEFLGDLASERENVQQKRRWRAKGVKSEVIEQIDEYRKDIHPLLSNWGALHKGVIALHDQYIWDEQEAFLINVEEPSTLLKKVQVDLLHLINPTLAPIKCEPDHSITVTSAPNKRREVENLLLSLRKQIALDGADGRRVNLSDYGVYVTDIKSYLPYIEMVFERGSCEIPIAFSEKNLVSNGSLKAVMELLKLPQNRFSKESVLSLFSYSSFCKKWDIDPHALFLFKKWTQDSRLTWGLHAQNRAEILGQPVSDDVGTWKDLFHRLLSGLVLGGSYGMDIDMLEASKLGVLYELIDSMEKDLIPFTNGEYKSVPQWIESIFGLVRKFFDLLPDEENALHGALEEITKGMKFYDDCNPAIPFSVIEDTVMELLLNLSRKPIESGVAENNHFSALYFSQLECGKISPAKHFWVLGLNDDVWPRTEKIHPLDELSGKRECDVRPSFLVQDRYAFLEAITFAQEALHLSYVSKEPGKNEWDDEPVSPLLSELVEFLQKGYGLELDHLIKHSPALGFDPVFFNSPKQIGSEIDYRLAKKYEEKRKEQKPFFPLIATSPLEREMIEEIRIIDLQKLARNPVEFYFNRQLKIYLAKEEIQATEREFVLSPLEKGLLRRESLETEISERVLRASHEGEFPKGVFGEVARRTLSIEVAEAGAILTSFGLSKSDFFTLHLEKGCFIHDRAHIPVLEIEDGHGRMVAIHGKIRMVTEKGLCVFSDSSLTSKLRVLPTWLIVAASLPKTEGKIFFLKDGLSAHIDPSKAKKILGNYIDYFFQAQKEISLFLPEVAEAFAADDLSLFSKVIEQKLSGRPFPDPYLDWLKGHDVAIEYSKVFESWKKMLAPLALEVMG